MTAINQEPFMLDEAKQWVEALIAAAREVVTAWDTCGFDPPTMNRVDDAIDRLEQLVGRP